MIRRRTLAVVATVAALTLAGCAGNDLGDKASNQGSNAPSASGNGATVRISGQAFPEAALVAAMYDELLTNAGYDTSINLVDTRDVYMKIFPGQVDVVPEYVAGIVDYLNTTKNGADAKPISTPNAVSTIEAASSLLQEQGITLLSPSAATDTNAFFVSKDFAEKNDLSTLSDLKGMTVTLAAAPDCEGRSDCAGGLEDTYGINIKEILPLGYASAQTYKSVLDGESQLGETSTTDGTLESQGLVLLTDDLHIQPAQNLVPAVSGEFLSAHPDIEALLNKLMDSLTTEKLTELNGKVAVDREKPADVAHQFLVDEGLVSE
jgi:osmoprotectant transport system substrate-binding protein